MSLLVTGGSGFIGTNFIIDWFSQNDELIINYDKLSYAGNKSNLSKLENTKNYKFIQGDIGDSLLLNQIFQEYTPRAVVNFAAESHVDRSISGPEPFIQTNIVGTFRLLEATRAYWNSLETKDKEEFRFLHVSTDEVYGTLKSNEPAFTETNQYLPNSPYSASKASSDHLVRSYFHTYKLPVLTTNCSNNYGPYQFPEKLIPLIIIKALDNSPLPIYGDGQQIRDWLYVSDHCHAIRRVLEAGRLGEVYNIGSSNEKTNLQIVHTICELLDEYKPKESGESYKSQIAFVKDRPGHDYRYAINASKIGDELGWKPLETFEIGLKKTILWYLENRAWTNSILSRSQGEENKV